MKLNGFNHEKDMQETVINWLRAQGFICTRELCSLSYNPMDIVGGRFGERTGRRIPPLLEAVGLLAVADGYVVEMIPATRTAGTHERIYKNLWRKLRREQ